MNYHHEMIASVKHNKPRYWEQFKINTGDLLAIHVLYRELFYYVKHPLEIFTPFITDNQARNQGFIYRRRDVEIKRNNYYYSPKSCIVQVLVLDVFQFHSGDDTLEVEVLFPDFRQGWLQLKNSFNNKP